MSFNPTAAFSYLSTAMQLIGAYGDARARGEHGLTAFVDILAHLAAAQAPAATTAPAVPPAPSATAGSLS